MAKKIDGLSGATAVPYRSKAAIEYAERSGSLTTAFNRWLSVVNRPTTPPINPLAELAREQQARAQAEMRKRLMEAADEDRRRMALETQRPSEPRQTTPPATPRFQMPTMGPSLDVDAGPFGPQPRFGPTMTNEDAVREVLRVGPEGLPTVSRIPPEMEEEYDFQETLLYGSQGRTEDNTFLPKTDLETGLASPDRIDPITNKIRAEAYYANLVDGDFLLTAQKEAYGEPLAYDPAKGEFPMYNADNQAYLGITQDEQAFGLLPPVILPKKPKGDATDAEWGIYYEKLKRSIKLPQYRVGDWWKEFNYMDAPMVRDFQRKFRAAGLYQKSDIIDPGKPSQVDMGIVRGLMEEANRSGMNWEKLLDLKIYQRQRILERSGGGGGYGGGGGGGGGGSTYTQITYNTTSMEQGRQLLASVLQRLLGRNPTSDEVQDFVRMLNKAERKSPTTTITRTAGGGGATTSTARVRSSTVDPELMAEQFAREQMTGEGKEYGAEYYLGLLMGGGQ